ncbi:MAG TPA: hypothetical protein VKZ60_13065 [Chloroflexota bacterium]|jgi:hypothetical protein|nr:hypothetical protein [Chloroflexota bacterium]
MMIAQRPWVARRGAAAWLQACAGARAVQRNVSLRWLMHLIVLLGLLGIVLVAGG